MSVAVPFAKASGVNGLRATTRSAAAAGSDAAGVGVADTATAAWDMWVEKPNAELRGAQRSGASL